MVLSNLYGEMRPLIGSPSQEVVADRDLASFLIPSLQWFASTMKCLFVTDSTIHLTAEQREYPLPPSAIYVVWVEFNSNQLTPASTWGLNATGTAPPASGLSGQTWMSVSSGTPTMFAVEGRQLILYPPASADVVAATPVMRWRFLSLGPELTNYDGISPQGVAGLTDLDLQVIRYDAAAAWLAAHLIGLSSDELVAQQAQIAAHQAMVARQLPECKERWMDSIRNTGKRWRVETSGRFGAAR